MTNERHEIALFRKMNLHYAIEIWRLDLEVRIPGE